MRPAKFTGRWIYPLLGFFAPLFLHATALAQCTRNCGTGGLAPDQLIFLYNFLGTPDGANPSAALVQDSSGNFFGTTENVVRERW